MQIIFFNSFSLSVNGRKERQGRDREEVEKNKEKGREEEREERRMKEKGEGRKEGGNGQADRGEHPFQTSYLVTPWELYPLR